MPGSAQIKFVRSLHTRKGREEAGLFLVEGEKMVQEVLNSAWDVTEIYRRDEVGEAVMARLSALNTPPPVLALVRMPAPPVQEEIDALAAPGKLCLALDGVQDPGNAGTLIRLADWFGDDALFFSPGSVDPFNPKTVQATMGSLLRKRIVITPLEPLCRLWRGRSLPVWGTFLDGRDIYAEALQPEGLVVMGNESRGISPEVASCVSGRLTIPSFAPGGKGPESLNVAVAAAITLSEFRRRG